MSNERNSQRIDVQKGYQPQPGDVDKYGYRPRDVSPVNVAELKPPSGGTAVEPPQQSAPSETKN